MNKILNILLIIFCLLLFDSVKASDIEITDVTSKEVIGTTTELSEPTVNDLNILFNFKVRSLNDGMTYTITIKNNTQDKYFLTYDFDNGTFDYNFDDVNSIDAGETKNIDLSIVYSNETDDSSYTGIFKIYATEEEKPIEEIKEDIKDNTEKKEDEKKGIVKGIIEELKENPKTGIVHLGASLLVIAFCLYLVYLKIKHKSLFKIHLFLLLLMMPLIVRALNVVTVQGNVSIVINHPVNLGEYVGSLVGESYIANDDPDGNIRFVGLSAKNYVRFNDEQWRIVGRFGDRVKILRDDSSFFGRYAWDSSTSSVNSGEGINDWSQAALMRELNGDYLDYNLDHDTEWYIGKNNETRDDNFDHTKVLSEYSQSLIAPAVWYTGSANNNNGTQIDSSNSSLTAENIYSRERSNISGKICPSGDRCNDSATRHYTWTGLVGLITVSDFMYSVGGNTWKPTDSSYLDRSGCLATPAGRWSNNWCNRGSWMAPGASYSLWTLTPWASTSSSSSVFYVGFEHISGHYAGSGFTMRVLPTVVLKSDVMKYDGSGTQSDPFIIGL